MYSRYHSNIPENYSGCAFSETRTQKNIPEPRRMEIAKPTPHTAVVPTPPRTESPPPEPSPQPTPAKPTAPVVSPIQATESTPTPLPCTETGAHPLLPTLPSSLGFEELLILGLILLLANTEQGSDMVLHLALLLLCG